MAELESLIEQGADRRLFRFLSKLRRARLSDSEALTVLLKRTELEGSTDIGETIGGHLVRTYPNTLEELQKIPGIGPDRTLTLLQAFSEDTFHALPQDLQRETLVWLDRGIESPIVDQIIGHYGVELRDQVHQLQESGSIEALELESVLSMTDADVVHQLLDLAALSAPPGETSPEENGIVSEAVISPGTTVTFYSASGTVASDTEIQQLRQALLETTDEELAILANAKEQSHHLREVIDAALNALEAWNQTNTALESGLGTAAAQGYMEVETRIRRYLELRWGTSTPETLLDETQLSSSANPEAQQMLIDHFQTRSEVVETEQLHELDWIQPRQESSPYENLGSMASAFGGQSLVATRSIDAPLATMLFAHIPLGVAEATSLRTTSVQAPLPQSCCCCCVQTADGRCECRAHPHVDVVHRPGHLKPYTPTAPMNIGSATVPSGLTHLNNLLQQQPNTPTLSWVERRWTHNLQARLQLIEADKYYKAQDLNRAESAYRKVLTILEEGGYSVAVQNAVNVFEAERQRLLGFNYHPLPAFAGTTLPTPPPSASEADRRHFRRLGYYLAIPNVVYPNPPSGPQGAHLTFSGALLNSHPTAYALALEAQARLVQLANGFNWLGYRNDYVPPWRFQYLLDRARYYTNHARQVQSTYLNFLSNAEREDLQERSAQEQVIIEDANVAAETKRLEQAQVELNNAHQNAFAQSQFAVHANQRSASYSSFSLHMNQLANQSLNQAISGAGQPYFRNLVFRNRAASGLFSSSIASTPGQYGGFALTQQGVQAVSNVNQQILDQQQQNAQRAQEAQNLRISAQQAQVTAQLAQGQVHTAAIGVQIAAIQRMAAQMRHRFALDTLNFLQHGRTLSARLWYRLASEMSRLTETYLNRAIELAFLAEQAFEFENNRSANVVRFDYDTSEFGEFLAADRLLSDLDSLEHEFITGETSKRQSIRYVVSMARSFPEELQSLREHGSCAFAMTLLPIERRFPGMYNLRVASVDLQPIALMDPTRFSVSLTHFGMSSIRIRQSAVDSPAFSSTDVASWCHDSGTDREWPVKVRFGDLETHVFSGLTGQGETPDEAFFRSNQRGAFEGTGAAAMWAIDMSMAENGVDPRTLADVVLTFRLTGYHSDELRQRILDCLHTLPPSDRVETLSLSARTYFPDGFYAFQNGGPMIWDVDTSWIPEGLRAGRLRNLGVRMVPRGDGPEFGRIMCRHTVRVRVNEQHALDILSPIPRLSVEIHDLDLEAEVTFDDPIDNVGVWWRFEDDGEWTRHQGSEPYEVQHQYRRPGNYTLTLRAQRAGRLYEYHASVAVANGMNVEPPLLAWPTFSTVATGQSARITVNADSEEGEAVQINVVSEPRDIGFDVPGNPNELNLEVGREYLLHITIMRELSVRLSSFQITADPQLPPAPLPVEHFYGTSNLEFDPDGEVLTTQQANAWAAKLLQALSAGGSTQSQIALSPLDRWELSIDVEDNAFLNAVAASGREAADLSEIEDVILMMEYEAEGL